VCKNPPHTSVVFCNPVGRFVYLFSSAQQQEYFVITRLIIDSMFSLICAYSLTGTVIGRSSAFYSLAVFYHLYLWF